MMVEAAAATAVRRGTQDRRATALRFVRRAAVSSAIATGALVAFAAPTWASTSDAATPDPTTNGAAVAVGATSTESGQQPGDGAASAPAATPGQPTAPTPDRGPIGGVVHGLAGLVGVHRSYAYAVPQSDGPGNSAASSASPTMTVSPTSPGPRTADAAVKPSITAPGAEGDGAGPTSSGVDRSSSIDGAAVGAAHVRPGTAPTVHVASAHIEASTPAAHQGAAAPATTTSTAAPATATTMAAPTTAAADRSGSSDDAAPTTNDTIDASVVPVSVITDTVGTVLEHTPAAVTSVVDQSIRGVRGLTAPLDQVAGGATGALVGSTLDTTAQLLDGVVAVAGQAIVTPAAHVVRAAGQATQQGTDGALGIVGALLPTLGGLTQSGTGSTTPSASRGGALPTGGDDADGTVPSERTGQLPMTLDAELISTTHATSTPAYVWAMARSAADRDTNAVFDATTSAAASLAGASQNEDATARVGGGTDLRVPVGNDQMPAGDGSGQGHSGPNQVNSDLATSWLPGAARLAVSTAEAWRLPGSVSFEPGHSPD